MKEALAYQKLLFKDDFIQESTHVKFNKRSGAFVDNMSLPVHRWYRYSAGFSAEWVRSFIRKQFGVNNNSIILDPFCGVATTLVASNAESIKSVGFEAHPFVSRIAKAKLSGMHTDIKTLEELFGDYLSELKDASEYDVEKVPALLKRCYASDTLSSLISMKNLFKLKYDNNTSEAELLWLVITSIIRICSFAGTAQWQYILPNKRKVNHKTPKSAFLEKATEILEDIYFVRHNNWADKASLIETDAREPKESDSLKVDVVITSPPYPNNYDYADATRLEMTFWDEIGGWSDLHKSVRRYLINSCSQHASAEKLELEDILNDEILDPIRPDLSEACLSLAEIRITKGGRKNYHTMAAAYFRDLGLVFKTLRKLCNDKSTLCFIIGDSAPYGIYLNVDKWLGELAIASGFKSYSFEKIRDRNIKWKNRKHRIPLKEGRLWIEG